MSPRVIIWKFLRYLDKGAMSAPKLYMGNNTIKVLKSLKFTNTPGENFSYDSATTAILGIVIERATGKPYAQYLSEMVWQPLGMERDALIGLDSKKSHTAKSYVQAWLPIIAAARLKENKPEEKELLMRWLDVVDYD